MYVMQPGDKIRVAGAYLNNATGEWEQKKRHCLCVDGSEIPWGKFVSANRAAKPKKKKAAKRGNKKDQAND